MTSTKDKSTYEMDAQCSNCDKTVKISFKKGTVCKGTQLCTNCGCQTAEVKKQVPRDPFWYNGYGGTITLTGTANSDKFQAAKLPDNWGKITVNGEPFKF